MAERRSLSIESNVHACAVCGGRTEADTQLAGYEIRACVVCTHRQAVIPESGGAAADYETLYASGAYRQSLVDLTRSQLGNDWSTFQTYAPFFAHFRPSAQLTVLDVACGTGRFVAAAAKAGFVASGVDVSETAVEVAREAFPGIDVKEMPVDALAADGRRYGVVTAFEFVEHTIQPPATLAALLDVVEANGAIFLTVPNWKSAMVRRSTLPEWLPPIHVQFFTRRSLRRLLAGNARIDAASIRIGFIPKRPLFPISSWFDEPEGLFATARVR